MMRFAVPLCWFFVCLVSLRSLAQDTQFSQYYAAPTYHNPAFAGGAYAPRVIVNYRNQWPSLGANFVTNAFSFDTYLSRINSGVGISLVNDVSASNRLKTTELAGQYAYQLRLADDHFIRFGLQAAASMRQINTSGLTFGDQFVANGSGGFSVTPNSNDPLAGSAGLRPKVIADFSTGALYFNQQSWIGVGVHHLTAPTISYEIGTTGRTLNARLPVRFSAMGGFNINLGNPSGLGRGLDNNFVVSPSFLFKRQGQFNQLDLGTYVTYSPLTLGVWYRGIPVLKQGANNDAFVGLVGFRFDKLSVGYSYDITISRLRSYSGGSHEISFSYQFEPIDQPKGMSARRRRKELSCPKF